MPKKPRPKTLVWRNSRQLAGVRAQLQAALNRCVDGAEVVIDCRTARNLIEICEQAAHTERGHGV